MRATMMAIAAGVLALAATSDATDPCQLQRLVAPEPYSPNTFGHSVARSGEYWFIADSKAETACTGFGCGTGAVYVYRDIGGTLYYHQTLLSSFPQVPDNYGESIAADGSYLVVGVPYSGFPGRADRPGAVFVYELLDGLWVESAVIEPPSDAEQFGFRVSLHDGVLAAADYDRDRVLVYEMASSGWELSDIVPQPDSVSERSGFGVALALDNERLVVGAPFDRSVRTNGGSAHIYTRTTGGEYVLEQSLRVDDPERIGWSVALDGDRVLTGAPLAMRGFEHQGVVYEYIQEGSQWTASAEISSDDPDRRDGFGSTLIVDGDRLFVTASGDGIGSVQAFRRSPDGDWQQHARLVPDTATLALKFGWALATDGRFLLVGAADERDTFPDDSYGAAYLFDLDCQGCPPDLDADGTLTIFDFLTFLNLFDAGDLDTADFDGDGELTIFDFLAFQTAFDAGCE